jgi:hypothetical protein
LRIARSVRSSASLREAGLLIFSGNFIVLISIYTK